MARKTCTRFEDARIGTSEVHNRRVKNLDYIREDLTPQNEVLQECTIAERLEYIHRVYSEVVHQKYQKSAKPIKEFVLIIDENTTMEQVKRFGQLLHDEFGFSPFAYFIHRDEGHWDKDDPKLWKPNLHAHIYVDTTCYDMNKEKKVICKTHGVNQKDENGRTVYKVIKAYGKVLPIDRTMCSRMQDLAAEATGMERGEPSDVKHLDVVEYKIKQEQQKLEYVQTLEEDVSSVLHSELSEVQRLRAENSDIKAENEQLKTERDTLLKKLDELKEKMTKILKELNNIYVYMQEKVMDKLAAAKQCLEEYKDKVKAAVLVKEAFSSFEELKKEALKQDLPLFSSAEQRFSIIENDNRIRGLSFKELVDLVNGKQVKHQEDNGTIQQYQIYRVYDEYELRVQSCVCNTFRQHSLDNQLEF